MLAGFCCLLAAPALAQEQADRIRALEKQLADSLRLIEALSARVSELERARATTAAAPAPAAPVAGSTQEIAKLQESVAELSDSLSKRSGDTGLPVHGFADVDAGWSGGIDPQKLRGFNAGTLDLYLTPQFGQRVKSLAEIAIEYGDDGAVAIDMERLQLGYTVSNALTVWLGRFHTPFGLWNTSFHHGANLQTSIFRPRFLDFEDKGGIIPAHSVGLWATGRTEIPGGKLTYDGFLSNGPTIRDRTIDFNAFTDDTPNKMLGGNLGYRPSGTLSGSVVGIHAFGSTVAALNTSGAQLSLTRLRMAGAYFGYDADNWEAIGEYYSFRNADVASGVTHSSTAWFAYVGKTLGDFTPYARHERVSLDPGDNYFLSQESGRSYTRTAAGLRYTIDSRSSLKFELSNTREVSVVLIDETGAAVPFTGTSYRRAAFQYSVAF